MFQPLNVASHRDSESLSNSETSALQVQQMDSAVPDSTSAGDEMSASNQFSLSSPLQSLRKSVSVDSFAQFNRDHWPIRGQVGAQPGSSRSPSCSDSATASMHARSNKQLPTGRLRGESLSSVQYTSNRPLDFDGDRYDPLIVAATQRYRRASLKAHDSSRQHIPGGDLPLPSRSPNNSVSSTGTGTIMMASANSSSLNRGTGSSGGRSRSGSAGYNAALSSKKIAIDTVLPPPVPRSKDVVLVVLGTPGCGKGTVIRKGLSVGFDDPVVVSENPTYVRRVGQFAVNHPDSPGSLSHVLQVFEGEISSTSTGLPTWPPGLPPIDGVILCYDSTDRRSFQPIEGILNRYRAMGLPVVVLACKADLENSQEEEVNPEDAVAIVNKYDTGLIRVSTVDPTLKDKMGKSFDYVLKAVVRQRASSNRTLANRNPASPAILMKSDSASSASSQAIPPHVLSSTVLDNSVLDRTSPTVSHILPANQGEKVADATVSQPDHNTGLLARDWNFPGASEQPASPSITGFQTLSTENVPEVEEVDGTATVQTDNTTDDEESHSDDAYDQSAEQGEAGRQTAQSNANGLKRQFKHGQWTHLDDLLDKLLFLAVSDDDPTFTVHFLLTYRRFATPRNVLLAMQKRIRQLDNPSGDPMFACFAQMRICHLLEIWIRDYPNDFAVKGTVGALNALIKSIISKTHLLHYGSEFLPFLEQLPGLTEEDTAWALQADILDTDSEDYNEDDEEEGRMSQEDTTVNETSTRVPSSDSKPTVLARERKASLPLPKVLLSASQNFGRDPSPKQLIKDLLKLANEVLTVDSEDLAREITRQCARRFLVIKPRDWLHFTFAPSTKKGEGEPIAEYNSMSNHLADWVASLILCHDRPRNRARQIEKFVEVALKIRQMNNYSGLRAFVAGINMATDDVTLEAFKMKSPDAAKNLMSWDVLLKQIRSHRAYRLALRNSKGSCIPAMEVHISDLIKAHEGNPDKRDDDLTMIHWGKFNMMARFICTVIQCQVQCRNANDYDHLERPDIAELLVKRPLMSLELQQSRLMIQDEYDDGAVSSGHRDISGLRKLFFW